jgi:hypothetical protein
MAAAIGDTAGMFRGMELTLATTSALREVGGSRAEGAEHHR